MSTDKSGWRGFLDTCLATHDPKLLSSILELFLTAEEKDNLAMRYLIIKELLLQKKTQREIAKDLNVSIAKITRGSNELKRIHPKLLQFLQEEVMKS